jgi:hypothetical protein
MILNPAVIALTAGSLLVAAYAVYASLFGMQIVQYWDIRSGSERQLALERRTYLISTVMAHLFGLVLFNAFFFVYTADHMHPLFVGAMCAAGTLNVNAYGYPLLVIKMLSFFLCGLWLIVNHLDGLAVDYPLIREKYSLLAAVTMLLALDAWLTMNYFGLLEADVITSCCGTLFSTDAPDIAGELASLPSYGTKVAFFAGQALLLRSGIHFLATGGGARLFGWMAAAALIFGLAAVIAFISVHYYELPTHHCPFCLLQGEYHYIGYPLYLALFTGGIAGAGVGVIDRFRSLPSLQAAVPLLQKRLCLWSMAAFVAFAAIAAYPMLFSDFKLEGY